MAVPFGTALACFVVHVTSAWLSAWSLANAAWSDSVTIPAAVQLLSAQEPLERLCALEYLYKLAPTCFLQIERCADQTLDVRSIVLESSDVVE